MKTYFIINPKSGDGKKHDYIKSEVAKLENCEVYITKAPKDATNFVSNMCKSNPHEELRFVACGGDGTINEVFSGAVGHDNASVSLLPIGTGNDFAKNFSNKAFADIKGISEADTVDIDYIKANDHYSFNCINFGFDTTVAIKVNEDRNKTGHGSKLSYTIGVLIALVNSMKNECEIYADGVLLNPEKNFLLCVINNGKYVGGSYKCAPKAVLDDGLMELCLVKPITRLKLISMISSYKKGTHLDNEKYKDLFTYLRTTCIKLKGPKGFKYSLDGEIIQEEVVNISIVKKGIKLAIIK